MGDGYSNTVGLHWVRVKRNIINYFRNFSDQKRGFAGTDTIQYTFIAKYPNFQSS